MKITIILKLRYNLRKWAEVKEGTDEISENSEEFVIPSIHPYLRPKEKACEVMPVENFACMKEEFHEFPEAIFYDNLSADYDSLPPVPWSPENL